MLGMVFVPSYDVVGQLFMSRGLCTCILSSKREFIGIKEAFTCKQNYLTAFVHESVFAYGEFSSTVYYRYHHNSVTCYIILRV